VALARLHVVAAAVACALVAVPSAWSGFPGWNGKIVFTTADRDTGVARDSNVEIYAANSDGSGQINVSRNPAEDENPAVSADGRRIAFLSWRNGHRSSLYLMSADGSGQVQLTGQGESDLSGDWNPAWSPSGSQLAFMSNRPGGGDPHIYIVNADGSGLTRIATGIEPAWSPDGARIVYVGYDPTVPGSSFIYLMNADGSDPHRLTAPGNTLPENSPAWSPDGTTIVFGRLASDWRVTNTQELYLIRADGSGETQLTEGGYYNSQPSWSPDGTRIVFQRQSGTILAPELYTIRSDGTDVTPIAMPGHNFLADWAIAPTAAPPSTTSSTVRPGWRRT
jgi:TolB protein